MPPSGNEILDRLDAGERGFVLGALLLPSSSDNAPCLVLEPPSDARCAEALARIAALPRSERVKLTRQLAREAVSPIPSGIEAVDESVLAALLRDEPPAILRLVAPTAPRRLRQAIAARVAEEPRLPPTPAHAPEPAAAPAAPAPLVGTAASGAAAGHVDATWPVVPAPALERDGPGLTPDSTSPELVIELQRAIFSRVVPVPPAGRTLDPPTGTARDLLLLDPARRTAELSRRGADVLGQSLHGAKREVILRAAAVAGPPWADQIVATATSSPPPASPEGPAAIDRQAALELVAAVAPGTASVDTVTRLGARATGARMTRVGERGLAGADQARALAQRLPAALGAELLSGAGLGPEVV